MSYQTRASADRELPSPPATGARREFLGVPIDCLTMEQTIAVADQAIAERRPLRHVCLNVAKLVAMRGNPELDADVRSSDVISLDGMGVVWAARLFGIAVPERVTGVDIMTEMLRLSAAKGYRPYFLGAKPEIVERAVANVRAHHP